MDQMRNLHLKLVMRLLLVAAVVSVAAGYLVIHNEHSRVFAVARDRALVRIGTLRALMLPQLDSGDLSDRGALEGSVRTIAYKGFDLSTGHYVLLRILDPKLDEVARVADERFNGVDELIERTERGPSTAPAGNREPEFAQDRIGGRDYVRALVPLTDSRGEVAAWAEGYFATTPEEEAAAFRRLMEALALAVGTVLLTSALLYPIILLLMRRLARLSISLLDSNLEMLQVIGGAIAKRDSDTDAHNYRVTIFSARLGEALGLGDETMRALIKGALLHDVGKIGIADSVLLKPGRLDETEFGVMKQHVTHGLDIVNRSAWLKDSAAIVGGHHEKFDGTGYFGRLKGPEIPLEARIFSVADVFDAVTSHRPYHEPLGYQDAMDLLMAGRGSHFDPEILDVFARIARPLFDAYANRDDEAMRIDHAAILQRYYRTDITAFMR